MKHPFMPMRPVGWFYLIGFLVMYIAVAYMIVRIIYELIEDFIERRKHDKR